MSIAGFADIEGAIKAWLATTPVAPLLARPGGGYHIYQAMPTGAPLPAVILTRVGGGPAPRKDLPTDVARISFHVWAAARTQASAIAAELAAACVNLAEYGGYVAGATRLEAAEIASWVWLPDPQSDTPRYVVDARFVAVTA